MPQSSVPPRDGVANFLSRQSSWRTQSPGRRGLFIGGSLVVVAAAVGIPSAHVATHRGRTHSGTLPSDTGSRSLQIPPDSVDVSVQDRALNLGLRLFNDPPDRLGTWSSTHDTHDDHGPNGKPVPNSGVIYRFTKGILFINDDRGIVIEIDGPVAEQIAALAKTEGLPQRAVKVGNTLKVLLNNGIKSFNASSADVSRTLLLPSPHRSTATTLAADGAFP